VPRISETAFCRYDHPGRYKYAQGLLSKYRAQAKCESASEAKVAHCVLRHLAKTQQIRLNIVRYDEGQRVATPAQIDEFFQDAQK